MKEKYKKLIKKYKFISFDIFDTLIQRDTTRPSDVFALIGKKYFNSDEKAESFRNNRKQAEVLARQKNNNEEINIYQIYDELNMYSNEDRFNLLNLELNTEIEVCNAYVQNIEIFNYAKSLNKKIFIITDMYLPTKTITEILDKNSIQGYDKLYVSNDKGKSKLSGKLFTLVREENNISKNKMLHFGDSLKADCLGAFKAGVKFVLTKRKNRLKRFIFKK